jgi:hypothetical protein
MSDFGAAPPSFYANDPNWESKLPKSGFVAPKQPTGTPTSTYIIGGVILVAAVAGWYYYMGPGSESEEIIPLRPTIGVKKGGYYYYDDF